MKKPSSMKKHKFDGIDATQVLQTSKTGGLLLNKLPIGEIELKNLKEEVKAFKNFRLFKVFNETVRHQAIEKGMINSQKWEETLAGKMMLHNLGILNSILSNIELANIPQKQITPPKKGTLTVNGPLT